MTNHNQYHKAKQHFIDYATIEGETDIDAINQWADECTIKSKRGETYQTHIVNMDEAWDSLTEIKNELNQ